MSTKVSEMTGILDGIEYFIFDVDGTLLLGKEALDFATELIKLLQRKGVSFTILSNNSSYSINENKARLEDVLEVEINDENIFTSTHATIEFLQKNDITNCYILGTNGLISDLSKNGIQNCSENPQAIILGFDTSLTYKKIKQTALLLQKPERIPFYATHPDDTCPTEEGEIPDVGSFLKMFEQATGRTADAFFGKPSTLILNSCLSKASVKPSKVLVIGDRLETDIKMANSVGAKSALVLTGETTLEDVEKSKMSPTVVWDNLEELYKSLQ